MSNTDIPTLDGGQLQKQIEQITEALQSCPVENAMLAARLRDLKEERASREAMTGEELQ